MTAEWHAGMGVEMLINPNRPGIKPTCNAVQQLWIFTPYRGPKAIWCTVGEPDGFVEVLILDNGAQRSKVFSEYVIRFRRRIVEERDGEEQANSLRWNVPLIKNRSLRLLNLLPCCLQASKLRAVLQRAQSRLRIKPIAEFLMLSTGYECFRESFIHAFVDEEAFQGDTSLAAEHEHASKQVLGDCVRIRIRKNDAGVVPA